MGGDTEPKIPGDAQAREIASRFFVEKV